MSRIAIILALFILASQLLPISAQQNDTSSPQSQDQKEQQSARETEESSSKDMRIDLAPPADDSRKHPQSGAAVSGAQDVAADVQEFQAWDPHKAAKDIEVGDFYYKRKNYRAARDRYKEALVYKPNDAVANFKLGECQEKTGNPQEAVTYYEAYLKILPHGPLAGDAEKALDRLKASAAKDAASK
jgi:tetratricopeptide (TPR) repeat protein